LQIPQANLQAAPNLLKQRVAAFVLLIIHIWNFCWFRGRTEVQNELS
jgi:hypothetical protein